MSRVINIYEGDAGEFDSEGLGTLEPIEWTYTNKGREGAILHMVHPYDAGGKWEMIQSGRIIRADVPVRTVPEIESGAMIATAEQWSVSNTATKAQRTMYSKRNGGKRKSVVAKGKTVTVVKVAEGRYKIKTSKNGTGWIDPDALDSKIADVPYDSVEAVEAATPSVQVRAQLFRLCMPEYKEKEIEIDALPVAYDGEYILTDPYRSGTVSGPDVMDAIESGAYIAHDIELYTDIGDTRTGFVKRNVNMIDALLNGDDSFVGRFGGDVLLDDWSVTILRSAGMDRGFEASYGRNLTGIESYEIDDNVVTAILPIGSTAAGEPLYLDGASPYVLASNYQDYPVLHMSALQVSEAAVNKKAGVTVALARQRMRAAVQAEWDKGVNLPKITLRIHFAMLGDSEEYRAFKALDQCHLYDIVHVWHPKVCGWVDMEVCASTWDGMRERYTDMELGTPSAKMTKASVNASSIVGALSGQLIAVGTLTALQLAEGTITEEKVADGAVTADKLDDGAVTEDKLDASAVTEDKIADGAVTFDKLAVGALKVGELRDNSANPNMAWKLSNLDAGTDELDLILIHDDEDGYVARINGLSTPTGSGGGITPQTYDYLHTLRIIVRNYKNEGGGVANEERASLELDPHYVFPSGNTYPALVALGSIVPDATNSYDLGTSTTRWRRIYLNNNPNVSSDARIKEGVRDLDGGLIDRLRPRSFRMRGDPSGRARMGFVAQEVQRALAEADLQDSDLVADEDPAHLGLHYEQIIAPLVAKVQELSARLAALERKGEE